MLFPEPYSLHEVCSCDEGIRRMLNNWCVCLLLRSQYRILLTIRHEDPNPLGVFIPSTSPTLLPRLIPRRPLRRRRRQKRTNLLPPPPKIIIQPHPNLLILAIIHGPIVRIPALGHDLANQRVRPHDPRFRERPVREMDDTGFP